MRSGSAVRLVQTTYCNNSDWMMIILLCCSLRSAGVTGRIGPCRLKVVGHKGRIFSLTISIVADAGHTIQYNRRICRCPAASMLAHASMAAAMHAGLPNISHLHCGTCTNPPARSRTACGCRAIGISHRTQCIQSCCTGFINAHCRVKPKLSRSVYITGHAQQAALTATGKAGCAAENAVDQCRGT
jgi:hypothetical protein